MGSCSSNLPILQAVSTIQEPVMDESNKKGLEVLITEGPEAMFIYGTYKNYCFSLRNTYIFFPIW